MINYGKHIHIDANDSNINIFCDDYELFDFLQDELNENIETDLEMSYLIDCDNKKFRITIENIELKNEIISLIQNIDLIEVDRIYGLNNSPE